MLNKKEISKIKKSIDDDSRMALIFNALSDHRRLSIFKLFIKHRGVCVSEIANIFEISIPATSQQLRILEMTGLITKERMGQMTCYKINQDDPVIQAIIDILQTKSR